jgi:hypothetical protein
MKAAEALIALAQCDREIYRHLRMKAWELVVQQNNFVDSNKLN